MACRLARGLENRGRKTILTSCGSRDAGTRHNDDLSCPSGLDKLRDGCDAAIRQGLWPCVLRHQTGGFLAHLEASPPARVWRFLVPSLTFAPYPCGPEVVSRLWLDREEVASI